MKCCCAFEAGPMSAHREKLHGARHSWQELEMPPGLQKHDPNSPSQPRTNRSSSAAARKMGGDFFRHSTPRRKRGREREKGEEEEKDRKAAPKLECGGRLRGCEAARATPSAVTQPNSRLEWQAAGGRAGELGEGERIENELEGGREGGRERRRWEQKFRHWIFPAHWRRHAVRSSPSSRENFP